MSLEAKITLLAQAIGADIKTLTTKQGDLTSLSTTAKATLVGALNELKGLIDGNTTSIGEKAAINDAATNSTDTWSSTKINSTISTAVAGAATLNDATTTASNTWSATKISTQITAAINAVVNSAPGTLDTLNELALALGNDANFSTTIATGLGNRVRFDAVQTLDSTQQLQACSNIGVGDPTHSFVADYTTAKA